MELKVDGSDLEKLLEGAVMQALGESGRAALVKHVVNYLTTKPNNGYGRDEASPLLKALNGAAYSAALKFFQERIASDPAIAEAYENLYREAVKKFLAPDGQEKLAEKMAERLCSAFESRY